MNGIFITAELDGGVAARIRAVQERWDPKLAKELPPHITLIGSSGAGPISPDTPVDELRAAIEPVARATEPLTLAFGPPYRFIGREIVVLPLSPHGPLRALHEALKAGRPVDVKISGIAADALGASRIGTPNFEVAQKLVRESVLVSDDAVRTAQRALWDELRIVAEPAGATGLAALMAGAYKPAAGERVATLVCGANTDPGSTC